MIEQIAAAVLEAPAHAGRTRVLAIDGRSGSGKSTLAAALAARLDAPVVDLELIYPGWDGLEEGVELLVRDVLAPLAEGRAARVPRYDWEHARFGEPWTLEPPALVIVEGVGAGARAAAAHASLLVWVELADELRKERALARDGEQFRPHWQRWSAQEDALLARDDIRARADVVYASPS